jgi:sigma-B regulation protein RsbU (phosphoserine phosphatase)
MTRSGIEERARNLLVQWGWPPRGRMLRVAFFLLALAGSVFLIQQGLQLARVGWAGGATPWIRAISGLAIVLFALAGFRWTRRKLLWRLRNRLIVTYVFIGVIPAAMLVLMATLAFYLFAGQFATYVVANDINAELKALEASNTAVAQELAGRIRRKESSTPALLEERKDSTEAAAPHEVCAWLVGRPLPVTAGQNRCSFTVPSFVAGQFREVISQDGKLYLRSGITLDANGQELRVASSVPLDAALLERLAGGLGLITLYEISDAGDGVAGSAGKPQGSSDALITITDKARPNAGFVIRKGEAGYFVESSGRQTAVPSLAGGSLPAATGRFDGEINFGSPLMVFDWQSGERRYMALLRVQTRPSLLYRRLFSALGEFALWAEAVLAVVAVLFGIIVLIALLVGTRLTRTVTGSVANLYQATQHINRGDFSHRIQVKDNDQLAELQTSFNSMTASLEKLLVEQREKQRLENELVIAQEVQAQLFPRQIVQLEGLGVHGFCRPARTVSGDYYDFLAVNEHTLGLAVGDVSGKGISAALLMATIHSAVRAYILEGVPAFREAALAGSGAGMMTQLPAGVELSPSALLYLLNRQLYSTTPTEKYATLFLGLYDQNRRRLTYSNAGHLPPLLISDDGSVRRLESGGTVVGLFDEARYDEASVLMTPGEIFVAYSDGVTEPENDYGEFGEDRLIDLIRSHRDQPLEHICEVVTAAVYDWIGANEQPDDITLVLARAR